MTRRWYPREYKEGDEKGIRDLHRLVFGTEISAEHWEWEYKANPAGQALMVVAEAEPGIVGHYALLPRLMKVADGVSLGSLSVDTMVHPEYRGEEMFGILAERAYELAAAREIQFIYGFPNGSSHHGFVTRLGWTDLYRGIPLWVKPLNLRRIMEKRFVRSKLLSGLGDKAGKIAMRTLYGSRQGTPVCSIRETPVFDPRFDALWKEASRSCQIMAMRDEACLMWRYVKKHTSDYVILIAERGADLLGYAVLRCLERFDLQIGFIVDILAHPEETRVSVDLIAAAVKYFELRQMDVVSCLMLPHAVYSRTLRQAGFIKAPNWLLPQDMYLGVRRFTSRYSGAFLTDPKNWFISWGDHDVI